MILQQYPLILATQEDLMDMESFDQILGLDEDDERSFSRDMIKEYFGQAVTTFEEMDEALYVPPRSRHLQILIIHSN